MKEYYWKTINSEMGAVVQTHINNSVEKRIVTEYSKFVKDFIKHLKTESVEELSKYTYFNMLDIFKEFAEESRVSIRGLLYDLYSRNTDKSNSKLD